MVSIEGAWLYFCIGSIISDSGIALLAFGVIYFDRMRKKITTVEELTKREKVIFRCSGLLIIIGIIFQIIAIIQ